MRSPSSSPTRRRSISFIPRSTQYKVPLIRNNRLTISRPLSSRTKVHPQGGTILHMLNSESSALLAVSIAFPVLAGVFVILRFAARRVRSAPEVDDWITFGALVT